MKTVTIHKAKSTLSQLIADVEAGEEVIISRGTEAVARLVPIKDRPRRVFGALAGAVEATNAFFDPLPERELESWE